MHRLCGSMQISENLYFKLFSTHFSAVIKSVDRRKTINNRVINAALITT